MFRLKGGGWYETDFKSDKENKRNLVGAEKEEPKPEAKAEAKECQGLPPGGQGHEAERKDVKSPTESRTAPRRRKTVARRQRRRRAPQPA